MTSHPVHETNEATVIMSNSVLKESSMLTSLHISVVVVATIVMSEWRGTSFLCNLFHSGCGQRKDHRIFSSLGHLLNEKIFSTLRHRRDLHDQRIKCGTAQSSSSDQMTHLKYLMHGASTSFKFISFPLLGCKRQNMRSTMS